jgi:hypothetical protein
MLVKADYKVRSAGRLGEPLRAFVEDDVSSGLGEEEEAEEEADESCHTRRRRH